ncbi:MAG: type III-B CRISPR-associated protein Cas10/Cmr2, partial [Nitrososphaerota archaeon]
MASDDLWKRKIQAFLYTPPDKAVAPTGTEERAKVLIAAALNSQDVKVTIPPEVEEAVRIAKGLDIPPFVEEAPADVFRQEPCLTHPLSGEMCPLTGLTVDQSFLSNIPTLQESIINAVKEIRQKVEEKSAGRPDLLEKRIFLGLWRILPEMIREKEKERIQNETCRIGPLWGLLPADPRIPCCSVWDHAAIASAVAAALPNPAFLIFTIASAQEFLTIARRTQDFWMGSYLLSYLTWQAIKVIADAYGPDCFVYPSLRGQPLVDWWLREEKGLDIPPPHLQQIRIANLPNRFTAIVPFTEQTLMLVKDAAEAAQRTFDALAQDAQKAVERALPYLRNDAAWRDIWENQRSSFTETLGVFWVILGWDRGSPNLDPVQKVEQALVQYRKLLTPRETVQVVENFWT